MFPLPVGVKVMLIVHFAFAANVPLQGMTPLPIAAWFALPIKLKLSAPAVLLVRVKTLGALVAPAVVVPKVKIDGEAVIADRPKPDTLSTCGELGALSVIVNALVSTGY